ncbi:peptidase domain-containing ABC transporter [Paenibacillus profundus]|uniref:Peptidase domain-containing ABC transporter n=1 Tax=Paenibacillus profundus TaxID=1173085 RepID=A0ABS8YRV1_9BACL|nr:peptidase domain-containing ABC transporter [Paenibacillus profundus]MCE5173032.1 peptidase domain-containing ABC transporter [Paenibacillus profundus]
MSFSKKVPYVEQMEYRECGLACLTMILKYYKYDISLSELRDEIGSSNDGYSFYHLFAIAKHKHMKAAAYKASAEDVKSMKWPSILHWENNHFVVLEKIKNGTFYILDPAFGRKKLRQEQFADHFSGSVLYLEPDKTFKTKKKTKSNLFYQDIKKEKKMLSSILFITVLLQLFAVAIPMITKGYTDEVLGNGNGDYLSVTGVLIFVLFLSFLIFSVVRGWLISRFQTNLDSLIMTRFMSTLFKLPFVFFENRSSGDILFRANSNIHIRQILSSTAVSLFIDTLLVFTYTALMFTYSVPLSLTLLAIAAVIVIMLMLNTAIIRRLSDKTITDQVGVQSVLSDSIQGISDIKMLGLEQKMLDIWREKFKAQLKSTEKLNVWSSAFQAVTSAIQFVVPLFMLWLGSLYVLNNQITIGTLIAFSTISASFIHPIVSLSGSYSEIIVTKSYLQRILDVVRTKQEPCNEGADNCLQGKIELKDVSFKYNRYGAEVIKKVSLTINPGETVAIVGASGSGKSTLAKLILGFYAPAEGEIRYDGILIDDCNLTLLRQQIGAVMQESKLFNRTIYENVSMMQEHISKQDVVEACKQAYIYEDIMRLPLQFDTIVSEKGTNFSEGQRQRLLLARALIGKKSILILDEATSALDNISEKIVDNHISRLSCTRIIIAHRLSTIVGADRIFVLADGEIAEEGDHKTLLSRNGCYANLYLINQNGSHNEFETAFAGRILEPQ